MLRMQASQQRSGGLKGVSTVDIYGLYAGIHVIHSSIIRTRGTHQRILPYFLIDLIIQK